MMAACDFTHTLVVTQDGALWACGFGGDGQLGLNDVVNRHMFERVGARAFGGARVVAAAAGLDGAWGRADRAVPGAAGGARAGVCDGHARMAGGGLARAVPGGGGGATAGGGVGAAAGRQSSRQDTHLYRASGRTH